MAGISDVFSRLCLGLALWNGRDPILKERMFGLTNGEGNHGEDVKDYWWYLDALPSQRLAALALPLPTGRVPVRGPDRGRTARGRSSSPSTSSSTPGSSTRPELDRRVALRQGGPDRHPDAGHGPQRGSGHRHPARAADDVVPQHLVVGRGRAGRPRSTQAAAGRCTPCTPSSAITSRRRHRPGRRAAGVALLRERDQRRAAVRRAADHARTPRTGSTTTSSTAPRRSIPTAPAPRRPPGTASPSRRARRPRSGFGCARRAAAIAAVSDPLGTGFAEIMASREAEADAFYADLDRADATTEESRIMRQAFAGMLWSKQFYAYDVSRWLVGDRGSRRRRRLD